jgi:hypothetical protein
MGTVIRLMPEYILAIQENPGLQGLIAQRTKKSTTTILRWCKVNASQLTMLSVLISIREYLHMAKDSVLTEHVACETHNQSASV